VGIVCICEDASPVSKPDIEFTFIDSSKASLSLPISSPIRVVVIPWSIPASVSVWVSHFDESVSAYTVGGKTNTIKKSIGMITHQTVCTLRNRSSHWVSCFGTGGCDFIKLVIRNLVGHMVRNRHACQCSKGIGTISKIKICIVNV
jgi:hypothetical protein